MEIVIKGEKDQPCAYHVTVDDKWADHLTKDEALGVVASAIFSDTPLYVKTTEEQAAWRNSVGIKPAGLLPAPSEPQTANQTLLHLLVHTLTCVEAGLTLREHQLSQAVDTPEYWQVVLRSLRQALLASCKGLSDVGKEMLQKAGFTNHLARWDFAGKVYSDEMPGATQDEISVAAYRYALTNNLIDFNPTHLSGLPA